MLCEEIDSSEVEKSDNGNKMPECDIPYTSVANPSRIKLWKDKAEPELTISGTDKIEPECDMPKMSRASPSYTELRSSSGEPRHKESKIDMDILGLEIP